MYHFLWLTNERPLAAFTCVWAGTGCLNGTYQIHRGHIPQLHGNRSFRFPLRGYLVISISCFLLAVTARMAMAVIVAL